MRQDKRLQKKASELLAGLGLGLESSDEEGEDSHRSVRTEKGRRLKSGIEAKASDVVVKPQIWPHVALQIEFVNKNLTFHELDFRLLTAGEIEIILGSNISDSERLGRLKLLRQVAYHAGSYEWASVRNLYAAIVRKIELGLLSWEGDFTNVEHLFLTKSRPKTLIGQGIANRRARNGNVYGASSSSAGQNSGVVNSTWGQSSFANSDMDGKESGEKTWFCQLFQKNQCRLSDPHVEKLPGSGRMVAVQHICANCWLKEKAKRRHAESDSCCPFYGRTD